MLSRLAEVLDRPLRPGWLCPLVEAEASYAVRASATREAAAARASLAAFDAVLRAAGLGPLPTEVRRGCRVHERRQIVPVRRGEAHAHKSQIDVDVAFRRWRPLV